MAKQFLPSMIVPAAKSTEFAGEATNTRSAKNILAEGIDRQIALFKDPKSDGRRWFTMGKAEVCLTLRVANKPLKLAGDDLKVVVPSEFFEEAMNHFKNELKAGKFDDQLAEADKTMTARKAKMATTRAAKKDAKP